MTVIRAALFAALFASAAVLPQQQDVEGSKDHPMFSRLPGYVIDNYEMQDFGGYDLSLEPPKHVEGRYWAIAYAMPEDGKKFGPLQIGRNYTDLIVKRGGRRLLEQLNAGGGTTVAQLPIAGKDIWVELYVSNSGEHYDLYVIEQAAMEQKVEFTAAELARALGETGSVALHNVLFDTGKATLKPESTTTLAAVGELLESDSALRLEIQGHTDNVGAAAANLKLSQDRAAAVKGHLVQVFAIEAGRLATAGFGDTKPVADNMSEEGRAQNRRVELVKK
jgi:OmpA-OmpF porin, OOP family